MPRGVPASPGNRGTESWPDPQQLFAQRLSRAREPRLDGTDRHIERESDFLVAQAVDLAQHERRALIEGQPLHRTPDACGGFLARQQAIGRDLARGLELAAVLQVIVERDEVGAPPPPPPALPVANLVDDDAIDPG